MESKKLLRKRVNEKSADKGKEEAGEKRGTGECWGWMR